MPYGVRRDGDHWIVYKRFGGRIVGRTDSAQKAHAMIRAIYSSEGKRGSR